MRRAAVVVEGGARRRPARRPGHADAPLVLMQPHPVLVRKRPALLRRRLHHLLDDTHANAAVQMGHKAKSVQRVPRLASVLVRQPHQSHVRSPHARLHQHVSPEGGKGKKGMNDNFLLFFCRSL